MAKNFSKYLGKIVLMTAAVLWTGCGDANDEKETVFSSLELPLCLYGVNPERETKIEKKKHVKRVEKKDIVVEKIKGISAEKLISILNDCSYDLNRVYEINQQNNVNINGKIVLELKVALDGSVRKISIVSSTTGKKGFDEYVKRRIERCSFPKNKKGYSFTVDFNFSDNKPSSKESSNQ